MSSPKRDKTCKTRQRLEDVEPAESPTGERDNVVEEEEEASSHGSTKEESSAPLAATADGS